MARSVSYPSNAAQVVYAAFECDDPEDAQYTWDDAVDYMQEFAIEKFPSLCRTDRWLGREDRVVLENSLACITVSEYCGLVAIAVVPHDDTDRPGLCQRWADTINIEQLAACFGTPLISKGRASNGEQFFTPAKKSQMKGELGLGFTSKEGWL
jgi:hypothetical protein